MKNLEKLHSEVRTLCSKKATAPWTIATAALVYQEMKQARQLEENRSWRRV